LPPVSTTGGFFNGTLTGGNGRPIFGGQTKTFQFDVPANRAMLNLELSLRDPNYNLTGFLIDPNGEALDIQSTAPITGGGSVAFVDNMTISQRTPQPGRWTVVLALNAPLTGQNLEEPFTAGIDFAQAFVTADGVPRFASTTLPQGVPQTITIEVHNTGISQKAYFVDPRLNQRGALELLGLNPTTVQVPITNPAVPAFLIPPDSDELVVVASGSEPIQMDINPNFGGPDIEGVSFASSSVAVDVNPEVTRGAWFALPTQVGPFGANGSTPSLVDTAAAVDTKLFDSAVTSDTGNIWAFAVDPNAFFFAPLILDPGQTGTITVTLTPNAPVGTVVRGALEIDTFNPNTLSGDAVIAIPYVYRVG